MRIELEWSEGGVSADEHGLVYSRVVRMKRCVASWVCDRATSDTVCEHVFLGA